MSDVRQEDIDEIKASFESGGVVGFVSSLEDKLNDWKKHPLNIAITGNSGAGKSSLINAIRNLLSEDEDGAPTGEVESTLEVTSYKDPNNKNLVYWDLPGVGTPTFPKETYMRQVEFERYDFYVILSSSRFTENDLWLGQQIQKAGKKFFFIRTKIDDSLSNAKKSYPKTFDKDKTLESIRTDCLRQLRAGGIADPMVFLISNYEQDLFDFEQFKLQLIMHFPKLKKEALTMSLSAGNSSQLVREKVSVLRDRSWKVGAASFVTNIIPGLGLPLSILHIEQEVKFYEEQLELDAKSLKRMAQEAEVSRESLQARVRLYTRSMIEQELIRRKGKVRSVMSIIPLLGAIINIDAASIACETLEKILKKYEKAALDILRSIETKVAERSLKNMDLN